jgi:hypothetical protein
MIIIFKIHIFSTLVIISYHNYSIVLYYIILYYIILYYIIVKVVVLRSARMWTVWCSVKQCPIRR